jgi:hypothetical protein
MNSRYIQELHAGIVNSQFGVEKASEPLIGSLGRLSEAQRPGMGFLREIGTLRIRPIMFQSGTAGLGVEDKKEIDSASRP